MIEEKVVDVTGKALAGSYIKNVPYHSKNDKTLAKGK